MADGGTDIVVDHNTTTESGNTITATSLHPASSSPTEAAGSERDSTRGLRNHQRQDEDVVRRKDTEHPAQIGPPMRIRPVVRLRRRFVISKPL